MSELEVMGGTTAPSADTQIREAGAGDIPALLPLLEAYWSFDGIPGFDAQRLRQQLMHFFSDPALGRAWLATVSGETAGYLLLTFVYSFEHGGLMGEVDELFIGRRWRGHGLGRALMGAAVQSLRGGSCVAIQMEVARNNDAAERFYRELGFQPRSAHQLWIAVLERGGT